MKYENYFKDVFESIADYRKKVILLILFRIIRNLLLEVGFSERDNNRLNLELKNILAEQFEEYLDDVENEEESIIENFSNK